MSDRTFAQLQARQKTLTVSSSHSRLLQRTCSCGGSPGIDGLCSECRDKQLTLHGSQRTLGASTHHIPTSLRIMDVVQRAATDNSRSLDESVRLPLEQSLGHNFSQVRVHYGPAASWAAEHLSARAYTLGSDIYLGNEAHLLNRPQYNRLLAHEAIHTVQQGERRPMAPQAELEVSHPLDAAEIEADSLSEAIISSAERPANSSRSLGLRDHLRDTPPTISRVVAPLIQRDLKGKYPARNGTFTLDLETAQDELPYKGKSYPATGMKGTIKFEASKEAPESMRIRLLQIARNEDIVTGKEYEWKGKEADRNELRTAEDKDKNIKPGYLVDILPPDRSQKRDLPVSPYYRDYWPNEEQSHDGSNIGGMVHEASLWDFPRSWDFRRYSFETAARATDTGFTYVRPQSGPGKWSSGPPARVPDTGFTYATIRWGFTVAGPSIGLVEGEHASVLDEPSATFGAAVKKFNEFYENPHDSNESK